MSDEPDLRVGQLRRQQGNDNGHGDGNGYGNGNGNGTGNWREADPCLENGRGSTRVIGTGTPRFERSWPAEGEPAKRICDPWRLLDAITKRSLWLMAAGLCFGAVAFVAGWVLTHYSAVVQLIRRETPNAFASAADAVQTQAYSQQTILGMMRSPEVLRRVSEKARPPISPAELAQSVKVLETRNPDIVILVVSGQGDRKRLSDLANVFAAEAVQYTRERQAEEAGDLSRYLKQKLASVTNDLAAISEQMIQYSQNSDVLDFDKEIEAYLSKLSTVDLNYQNARIDRDTLDLKLDSFKKELAKQNPVSDHLQSAEDELTALLSRYTEDHPAVQAQRARISSLERQGAARGTNIVGGKFGSNSLASGLYMQILEMNSQKLALQKRMEEYDALKTQVQTKVKGLSEKAVKYAVLKGQQQSLEILRNLYANRHRDAQLLQENALGPFRIYAGSTPESVNTKRRQFLIAAMTASGAVLGALIAAAIVLLTELVDSRLKTVADLERVTRLPVFATLGDLRRMSPSDQVAWAFRTLTLLQGKLHLLPDQSLVCGFISSHHGEGRSTWINLLVSAASQRGLRVLTVATRSSDEADASFAAKPKDSSLLPVGPTTTLNRNALAFPAQVVEQFKDPEAQPVVHIPLPGWVWNLERRKQWQSAVAQWRQIENLVLLIELPPACEPESVLLAENLPQVIWLAESGKARAEETQVQLDTLRHARCNLVGSVLNRETRSFWRKHFASWTQRFCFALGLFCLATGAAETNQVNPRESLGAKTGSSATTVKRAPWQERLTLGPGDTIDVGLYGYPELARTNIVVGPDGRINYLQAQNVSAAGLTIDELRAQLDQALKKYYLAARTVITPGHFRSKKYFILGKVVDRGVFTLDRPLTILEAVARARGLETAMVERNTVEAADLSRSFLIRHGKRQPVDLARLFQEGDLSQNIALEPDDYLYFPPANLSEIYVLGEVMAPGIAGFTSDASVLAVISERGGFAPKAYQKKVLVIRGSLDRPETFVVDTSAILSAAAPDFKLQARDIVYVALRPWAKVEELLDIAGQAFIEAAVTAWTGSNVGPVITRPIAPRL